MRGVMKKVLIIEDEPNIRELILYNLEANGFQGIGADEGIMGITLVHIEKPDLILLDIMLPGKNGYDICKELRAEGNPTPIIMLTAKSDEIDKVLGLEFGADDYITKPFGIRELMARINAVLRRVEEKENYPPSNGIIIIDELAIDPDRHQVSFRGEKVELTSREFDLIHFLSRNRGVVFTRDQLLDKVWGIDYAGETRTVDVHIRYIRRKLGLSEQEDRYIQTIRGKGYKMA
jgi:two-component system alkaline phosphatase synthesis response regulator PhoP